MATHVKFYSGEIRRDMATICGSQTSADDKVTLLAKHATYVLSDAERAAAINELVRGVDFPQRPYVLGGTPDRARMA